MIKQRRLPLRITLPSQSPMYAPVPSTIFHVVVERPYTVQRDMRARSSLRNCTTEKKSSS